MMHSKSTPVYLTFKLLQTQKAKSCHEYFLNQHSPLLLCLRNRTTLSFFLIFFFKFFFVLKAMHFSYMGRLVTNKQKFKFSVLIFACRLVLYLYASAIENPEISGSYVSKSRDLRTDYKRVKNIETYCCCFTDNFILVVMRAFITYCAF